MRPKWMCVLVLGVASAAAQESPGSIRGTVVDVVGSQVPGATVTIVGPVSREAKTDSSGEFVIAALGPGVYTLQVQCPGFVTRDIATSVVGGSERSLGRIVLDVGVPPTCEQGLKSQLIFDKKLRSGGKPSLSGILRDETGVRLKNATILLLIADTSQAIAIAKTNEKGEFHFLDVSSGIYDFSFDGFLVPNLRIKRNHAMKVFVTVPPHQICL